RPGRVRPGEAMPDRPGPTDAGEAARPIAAAVVGEEAPDRDPAAPKPPERIPEKRRTSAAPLGPAHFDEGDAGRIVNRDVDVLIPDPPGALGAIAMHAVPDPADAAERFDVHVQQIAGVRPLVALNHRRRIELADAIQPRAPQHARHGGARDADPGT